MDAASITGNYLHLTLAFSFAACMYASLVKGAFKKIKSLLLEFCKTVCDLSISFSFHAPFPDDVFFLILF